MEIFHALYVIQTNLALKENNRNLMNVKKCFENMIIFLLNDILKELFYAKKKNKKIHIFLLRREKASTRRKENCS